MSHVKRLLGRHDVPGLVDRLDKKDGGDAAIALIVLGKEDTGPQWPPRPDVVNALCEALGTPEKADAAAYALVGIGAPALRRLSDFIYDEKRNVVVGSVIAQIRERGVPLPDECVVLLSECMEHSDPSKSAERRQAQLGLGWTAEEIEDWETRRYPQIFAAAANAMGGAARLKAVLQLDRQKGLAESPSHDEVVDEIMTLDERINGLAERGKGKSDPEWQDCDDRLTAIGEELYADGGEERMKAVLQLAYQKGLRGRYAERHWTGIGTWIG